MSSMLYKDFTQLAWEGIIAPHQGYEIPLLLKGIKPVHVLDSDVKPHERDQLDDLFAQGVLARRVILKNTFNKAVWGDGMWDHYYYALPENAEKMHRLADFYEREWRKEQELNGFSADQYRMIGNLFGYTERDTAFFLTRMGLSDAYTPQEVEYLYATNDIRRQIRYGAYAP
jgi:hypothetical protein